MRPLPDRRDDDGFGLLLVIGMSVVLLGLIMLSATIAGRSLRSSNDHVRFEQSLTAAESGVDQTIARLQRAYVKFGTDFPVPSLASSVDPTPSCLANPATYAAPASGFASESAERAWANSKITALLTAQPNCLQHGPSGDYVVLKPSNRQVVYAMGWSPSRSAKGAKRRLVKSEYLFQPYRPSNAVLTGGNLLINASTSITTVPGSDPTLASVHSNGTVSVANGNPIVYGSVSSTQVSTGQSSNKFYANPGGAVVTSPQQPLPQVSAQAVYSKWSGSLASSWYDLCPDGKVKQPTTAGPCATTAPADVLADLGPGGLNAGTKFRGFEWQAATSAGGAPTWLVGKNVPDGVYYAYRSNVAPATGAGNTATANATILAQAVDNSVCQKVGGSISWDHNDISAPLIPNLFMLAEADLTTSSNFSAGSAGPPAVSGLFVAGDQVHMSTSSNGAYGAVVASDGCPPSAGEVNEIKNPSLYYDPNAEAPFTDVINTTLWLEYVG